MTGAKSRRVLRSPRSTALRSWLRRLWRKNNSNGVPRSLKRSVGAIPNPLLRNYGRSELLERNLSRGPSLTISTCEQRQGERGLLHWINNSEARCSPVFSGGRATQKQAPRDPPVVGLPDATDVGRGVDVRHALHPCRTLLSVPSQTSDVILQLLLIQCSKPRSPCPNLKRPCLPHNKREPLLRAGCHAIIG